MFLSGKRNTTGVWQKVQRVAMIAILLFSLTGVENAMADMIETTETQIKQNVNNVKNDIKNLQNKLNDFAKQAGGMAQSEVIKPLIDDLKGELKKALKDPKNYNGKNLEKIVSDLEEKGKDISTVKEITADVRKTINDIKNIATVIFTAPVGLSGGYGQTGLKIEMDPLTYKRKGAKEGSTSIKAKAEFQLPFSISGDGGNTKIGFLGDINLIGENNSSKLFAYVENSNQVSSGEMTYYPILEGKAELGVHKESYIEVDCNGFKRMRLKGEFRFKSSVLYNADPDKQIITKEDSMVTAEFDINISDLEDILIETSFKTPFKIHCTGDIVYKVTGVIADLSTVKNAENFQFPRGYRNPFKGSDEAYWTGFALKALEVNVEKELPFVKTLNAYNMLIDETGISGWFGAGFKDQKLFDTPAIGVNIDTLAVGIASNKVVGGTIGGALTLKMLKDKKNPNQEDNELILDVNGTLYSDNNDNLCYSFDAKINKGEYDLPFLQKSGTVISILEGTSVSYQKENNPKYKPDDENCKEDPYRRGFHFVINGNLSMNYSFLQVENLQFQNLKFSTCEPYFGGGTFALNSAKSMNLGGLEIALNKVSVGLGVDEDEVTKKKTTSASIGADVTLRLIGDGKGVSVGTAFQCGAYKKENEKWQIGGFSVDKIMIDVDFSAFHLAGMIQQYGVEAKDQNTLFGKGFIGSINLKLDMLNIDVTATAQFGKTRFTATKFYDASKNDFTAGHNGIVDSGKEYKYWYVFAGVNGLKGVVIFPPSVMLEGVSLGLFSHMSYTMNQTTKEISRNYYPDASKKFGIQGGVKFFMAQESLIGAQVKLGLMINDHGGVSEVTLDGGIYMLGDNVEKAFVKGTVNTKYDFEKSIFTCHGNAEMGVSYLKGTFKLDILSAPKNWHFYVGTNSSPVGLKFVDIIKTKSYFMLGHGVPTTLAPLDPRITELFGVTQSTASGKTAEMESGKGFAFGASICVDCGFKGFVYAGATLLGGLDVLVIRNQTGNCENTKYRGSGRAYVYLDLGAGVKPRKKKFEFIDFVGSSKLYAEFPKPLYIEGDVAFKYSVLGGLFKGTVRTHFDAGKTCSNNDGSDYNSEGYKRPSFDIYDDQDVSILHKFDTEEEITPEMIDAIEGLTPEQKEQMKKELENSGN